MVRSKGLTLPYIFLDSSSSSGNICFAFHQNDASPTDTLSAQQMGFPFHSSLNFSSPILSSKYSLLSEKVLWLLVLSSNGQT